MEFGEESGEKFIHLAVFGDQLLNVEPSILGDLEGETGKLRLGVFFFIWISH